ncbi:acyl carrier protein [Aquabacterium humicola]|uniref:acyl carrier protein n=1 Tax=Aquabacterium humicola TaxID=3237377 RepID=UPI002543F48E|nr:phosphopantetheine-binding protein [Rubrivivax pictus]
MTPAPLPQDPSGAAAAPVDTAALRATLADSIAAIAPEARIDDLVPRRSLRAQLDLDSYDFLQLLIELHERLGVDVPEADYARVDSLDGLLDYLAARTAQR